jgi:hypothetical protein
MFGRKKKEEINPYEQNDNIGLEQLQNNLNNMNNLISPQVNQVQNQVPNQMPMQQVQAPTQFQKEAMVIKAEVDFAENDYVYIIRTNYPLSLGRCNVVQ